MPGTGGTKSIEPLNLGGAVEGKEPIRHARRTPVDSLPVVRIACQMASNAECTAGMPVHEKAESLYTEADFTGSFRQHVDLGATTKAQDVQVMRGPVEYRDRLDGRDTDWIVTPCAAVEESDIIHGPVPREVGWGG